MKAMQDKKFDKIFADALGDMEEMPSEKAWAGIAGRTAKPKRSYWNLSVAASLLLMLSAGLLMYTKKQVEPKDNTAQIKAAKRIQEARPEEWHQQALREEQKQQSPVLARTAPAERTIIPKTESVEKPLQAKNRPVGKEEQEFKETFASQPQEPVLNNDFERISLASAESLSSVQMNNVINEPEKIAVKTITIPADKLPAKKHPVKSIGDLVNLVVAKVDKREEKIIQFTDSDGESNVTGINLGFINIQKTK